MLSRRLLPLLFASFIFCGELEVDGNLKVTGNIDANGNAITNVGAPLLSTDAVNAGTLASALGSSGPYEYLSYKVLIYPSQDNRNMEWIQLGDNTGASFSSNFIIELNSRALEGYEIHSTMNLPKINATWNLTGTYGAAGASTTSNESYTLFILKRKVSDD